MGLSQEKLKTELLRFFRTPEGISSYVDAEDRWAQAYHAYASDAEDISGDLPTNLSQTKFRNLLDFRTPRYASVFAQVIDRAFVSYWTGTVFGTSSLIVGTGSPCPNVGGNTIFGSETTSVVSAVLVGAMKRALLPVLFVPGDSFHRQAEMIASAMHVVTVSAVTVLITGLDTTPPTAGPFPITNTCTIF